MLRIFSSALVSFLFLTLLVSSTYAHLKAHGKVEPSAGCSACKSSLSFQNPKAAEYAVGTNIPLLPFKTKNSWAGNIPIPDTPTLKNGSLFFWLWGQDSSTPGDDLIIWLNGGPGCSSIGLYFPSHFTISTCTDIFLMFFLSEQVVW